MVCLIITAWYMDFVLDCKQYVQVGNIYIYETTVPYPSNDQDSPLHNAADRLVNCVAVEFINRELAC
jgi:hypothetical protein